MKYTFSDGIYRLTEIIAEIILINDIFEIVYIPYGFAWNGVTSFKTTKKTLKPSMIHDWLIYDNKINGSTRFTRKEIDKIFIILCRVADVPFWQIMLFKTGLNINRNILMKLENKQ